jgi:hypothetical protein
MREGISMNSYEREERKKEIEKRESNRKNKNRGYNCTCEFCFQYFLLAGKPIPAILEYLLALRDLVESKMDLHARIRINSTVELIEDIYCLAWPGSCHTQGLQLELLFRLEYLREMDIFYDGTLQLLLTRVITHDTHKTIDTLISHNAKSIKDYNPDWHKDCKSKTGTKEVSWKNKDLFYQIIS